jgi:uncharacterized membrane protein
VDTSKIEKENRLSTLVAIAYSDADTANQVHSTLAEATKEHLDAALAGA